MEETDSKKQDKTEDEIDAAEYREYLVSSKRETQYTLDKFIISLSGGAISLSVLFIANVLKGKVIDHKYILLFSWIMLVSTIASVLISFLSSVNGFTKAINDLDEDKLENESPSGIWNTVTKLFNLFGILLLTAGTSSLLLFVYLNL